MNYAELNILGVYVAPIAPMFVLAFAILFPLRHLADHLGLFRKVWHPALFVFALYMILLSVIVLLAKGVFV